MLLPNMPLLLVSFALLICTEETGLPGGTMAIVNGEIFSETRFHSFVGKEFQTETKAQQLLQQMIREHVILFEAENRGVRVDDGELNARIEVLDRQTRDQTGGKETLESILSARGIDRRVFMDSYRVSLLAESLARLEFEIAHDEEVPFEKTELWIQEQMKRTRIDTRELPEGSIALVNDRPVSLAELGRRYFREQTPDHKKSILTEFVDTQLIAGAAAKRGLSLTDTDLDAAIADRQQALEQSPDLVGASVEEIANKTGRTLAWLRESARFRNRLLMEKMLLDAYPGEDLRTFYDENRAEVDRLFGASVRIRGMLLRAGHEGARRQGFVPRLYDEAEMELDAIKQRLLEQAVDFETLARSRSEHASKSAGGDLGYLRESDSELGVLAGEAMAGDDRYVGPVRTLDGAWLLEVVDRRPSPGFEDLRHPIEKMAAAHLFAEIRDNADIRRKQDL